MQSFSQLDRTDGRTGRGVFVVFIIRYLIIYTTYLYLCLCLPAGYIYIYIYILHLHLTSTTRNIVEFVVFCFP